MVKKRFLFISPHPDDAELGIGGTILKLKKQGHAVFMVDLTDGEPTPFGSKEKREKETEKATKILGVDERINLGLPNRYLCDNQEARLLVAETIRKFKPDILFCPYSEDAHPDHLAATKITEAARFYAKYTKVDLAGQPHYPFYLFYFFSSHLRISAQPNFFIDISDCFAKKIRAIKSYRSQFIDNFKNKFVFSYVENINHYWGSLIRKEFAEGLFTKEAIKLDNLQSIL
ncbi:MAG: bacillithiol biosynthesis deacetylase BshB1 [Candidatus Omnitrophica bacterium]|nr:bacillithiol biosynthesis deacetylase BshB1 [Candidatus Omnitrophota bacterium]MCF7878154.1 bacillithiol biosynthesis deacetylase BshB1 [Candidatus Omnitrophota bacterium]MCF7893340.1 bacillithiol biosynthesis deacetylase BshB1 [Candidatus Omnitrophota bacterium]